jgi:hypothetical protein
LFKQLENGTKKIGATIDSIARPRLIKVNMSGNISELSLVFRKVVVATLIVILFPYVVLTSFAEEFLLAWIGYIPEHSVGFIKAGLLLIFIDSLFKHLMNLIYIDKSPKKFQVYSALITLLFLSTLFPIAHLDMGPLWFIWTPVVFAIIGLMVRYIVVPKKLRNRTLLSGVRFDVYLLFVCILMSGYGLDSVTFFYRILVLAACISALVLFYNRTLFKINMKSLYALFSQKV